MKDMMTYREVAELTNLQVGTVYSLVSARRIPFIRLGPRLVRFRRADILAWLAAHEVQPEADSTGGARTSGVRKH